ncbi:hypothetical protein FGIG_11150 [Fasciola gigantica]|uniref:Uncharacterized protein n=1 Tax=Fasciola gigantica TaxID=46835 RepID=A0A504YDM7_FASGI|nr:hypothetical protein FGIG_11150 [Fasciola gigantica]
MIRLRVIATDICRHVTFLLLPHLNRIERAWTEVHFLESHDDFSKVNSSVKTANLQNEDTWSQVYTKIFH